MGKTIERSIEQIRKDVYGKQQRSANFAFQIDRDADVDMEARTVKLAFASDKPIDNWWYGQIKLNFDKKSIRTQRLDSGAPLLMDHNTRDVVGVIEDYSFDTDGLARATVRFGESERAEEVFNDVRTGIRRNVSVGFMIYDLQLESKGKDKASVYRADDWEPYEVSIVAVPADISVGVGRAADDSQDVCSECEMPLDDCTCEMSDTTDSESRSKRQINPKNGERNMGKENEGAGTDPVVETRSREAEIMDFAGIFGDEGREIARDMIAASGSVTIEDVRSKIKDHRAAANKTPQPPVEQPQDAAKRQNPGVELARTLPRHGKVTAFKGERAAETAYRFGMSVLASGLYDPEFELCRQARKFCQDHGLTRAMGENVNETGGALVLPEFSNEIIDLREDMGVFRQLVKNEPMNSDTKLIPRRTGGPTAYFVAEAGSITASDASWDNIELVAKKLGVLCRYSTEVNEDSIIDFANTLAEEIAYAFAQKEDDCGFNGDGSSTYGGITGIREKIKGLSGTIANIAGLKVGTGNQYSELLLADFRGVVAKLPRYASKNAVWVVHNTFYWDVMVGALLAGGGVTAMEIENARSEKFLGYPVVFSQVMPSVEANSQVCCLFGDFAKGARIGTRRDVTIAFSEHSRFANDQIEIRGTERFDINVHDVGNASATAASRVPGPIVGLITAAS